MNYLLSIPARINLLGNPSDGVEGDFATLSTAINLFAHARITPAQDWVFQQSPQNNQGKLPHPSHVQVYHRHTERLPYDGELDLLKGAFNLLRETSAEFEKKAATQGFHLTVWSEVPRQSGLGGSSLFVLLALAAFRAFFALDPRLHHNYYLAELAQRVEARELGITCGYADRYVPLFGGIAYIDYRGKLFQQEMHAEPYATYERLDSWIKHLPIVIVATGIEHSSGDIHGVMRQKYLHEYRSWKQGGSTPPPMMLFMSQAWETAWKGKIALLRGDLDTFGELMNQNHFIIDEMMKYCGFPDGAGWVNNLFITQSLRAGAMGAKLTGAGGGGSVFALAKTQEQQRIISAWQKLIQQNGFAHAQIFFPKICHHGLRVRKAP